MGPDFCKTCHKRGSPNCQNGHKACGRWRAWFRQEWALIQKALLLLKANKEG